MTVPISNSRDMALLNMVGLYLFRLILKARDRSYGPAAFFSADDLVDGGTEAAIGYEAAWTGECSDGGPRERRE